MNLRLAAQLGLSSKETRVFSRLDTPARIQQFLNQLELPLGSLRNRRISSVREVIESRSGLCMEGALLAACALWLHGRPPVLMRLSCADEDYPHVVAIHKDKLHIGAYSKANAAWLRYRDPIYRSYRKLAMSYFHEYCSHRGAKTLRSYSAPIDLRAFNPHGWVTTNQGAWEIHEKLANARHYQLLGRRQLKLLVNRDIFCRSIGRISEH